MRVADSSVNPFEEPFAEEEVDWVLPLVAEVADSSAEEPSEVEVEAVAVVESYFLDRLVAPVVEELPFAGPSVVVVVLPSVAAFVVAVVAGPVLPFAEPSTYSFTK